MPNCSSTALFSHCKQFLYLLQDNELILCYRKCSWFHVVFWVCNTKIKYSILLKKYFSSSLSLLIIPELYLLNSIYLIFLTHLSLLISLHNGNLSLPFHSFTTLSYPLIVSTLGYFFLIFHKSTLEILHLNLLLRFSSFTETGIALELTY